MDISSQKSDDLLVIRLAGRLDANWCNHVQNALAAAVRGGDHRVHLDMADVVYVSSAGLRVLLSFYKQLQAINGLFGVARPSAAVRSVLELAGLEMLIAASGAPAAADKAGRPHASPRARYEIFAAGGGASAGVRVTRIGDPGVLAGAVAAPPMRAAAFGADTFALGVGALGLGEADGAARSGEFLAAAGVAAFQPADGSSRPDFVVSQGALVPEGRLLVGLIGEGGFSTLARFEASAETRTVGLAELAQTVLELGGAPAAAFVAVAETSGLVGATLRRSPAAPGAPPDRFRFPGIRDWLSFTSERAFRDSTSLLVGVVARAGSALDPLLRPLSPDVPGILAHVHAAAFPYRPVRKGSIELRPSVTELFDGPSLQAVMHLLADAREINGAGESEFYRGALWIAPVQTP
jgi:anti-anti-sigma factor